MSLSYHKWQVIFVNYRINENTIVARDIVKTEAKTNKLRWDEKYGKIYSRVDQKNLYELIYVDEGNFYNKK